MSRVAEAGERFAVERVEFLRLEAQRDLERVGVNLAFAVGAAIIIALGSGAVLVVIALIIQPWVPLAISLAASGIAMIAGGIALARKAGKGLASTPHIRADRVLKGESAPMSRGEAAEMLKGEVAHERSQDV